MKNGTLTEMKRKRNRNTRGDRKRTLNLLELILMEKTMTYFFEIGKIQNHIIKSTKKLTKTQVKSL